MSEADDEVRQNIPEHLIPLYKRIGPGLKKCAGLTKTEAFLQYVDEHPGEDVEALDRVAEWRLKQELRPMLDFYETPSWAIRAVFPMLPPLEGKRILDPGCGTGAILRAVGAAFPESEIVGLEKDRARFEACQASTDLPVVLGDFNHHADRYDFIISNPPYSYAIEFVQHALRLAPVVCMLLRLPWLASQRRAEWHRENPAHVCVLPKRPSFTGDGKTDATEYAWFIWGDKNEAGRWSILNVDAKDTKKARR